MGLHAPWLRSCETRRAKKGNSLAKFPQQIYSAARPDVSGTEVDRGVKKICFIKCSPPRWPFVPVASSPRSSVVWGGEGMNRGPRWAAASTSPQLPVVPSLSELRQLNPHAMERCPLPGSANYSDAASTDGRAEVCLFACLVEEETNLILVLTCFFHLILICKSRLFTSVFHKNVKCHSATTIRTN